MEAAQPDKAQQAAAASQRLNVRLWSEAVAAGEKEANSVLNGLFIESLNRVLGLHVKRVQTALSLRSRVPGIIWATLYFVACLDMAGIGYHEGLSSLRRSPAVVAFVLTFSAFLFSSRISNDLKKACLK